MVHEHKLVYLGEHDEGWGKFALRWCRECGLLYEDFGDGHFATMTPSWAKKKLEEAEQVKYRFVLGEQFKAKPKSKNRLGRSLADMLGSSCKEKP
jgi:hypothetical protein